MSGRVKIPKDFGNLKDDNERLNDHTKRLTEDLGEILAVWTVKGFDARAIYATLALYHDYYYVLGLNRLGAEYMSRLEEEAHKLSRALLDRRK